MGAGTIYLFFVRSLVLALVSNHSPKKIEAVLLLGGQSRCNSVIGIENESLDFVRRQQAAKKLQLQSWINCCKRKLDFQHCVLDFLNGFVEG